MLGRVCPVLVLETEPVMIPTVPSSITLEPPAFGLSVARASKNGRQSSQGADGNLPFPMGTRTKKGDGTSTCVAAQCS